MDVNFLTREALAAYFEIKAPGYAVLIDSPWGSGKTHFVFSLIGDQREECDIRYISLNGVTDEAGFRRALLKDSMSVQYIERAEKIGNAISKLAKSGNIGSLGRDLWEENLLSRLPQVLIFDDLERSLLDPQLLIGLINNFIEHEGKNVVLLMHSGMHDKKSIFSEKKEKIIGKTLRISPDVDQALSGFISEIDEGIGKQFLTENTEALKDVFVQAGHENLRLLRNAVRECGQVLNRIEDSFFEAKEPMERFVRTFLALAMAYGKSEIFEKHLKQRDNFAVAFRENGGEEDKPLATLRSRHPGADITAFSGCVLPKSLALSLFVDGYVATDDLNSALQNTQQFNEIEAHPLWKRFVHFGDSKWEDLKELFGEAESYLFEKDLIDPGPYIHILDSYLRVLSLADLQEKRAEAVSKIKSRLVSLAESKALPEAKLGVGLGWGKRPGHFSYGGYGFDPKPDVQEIIDLMEKLQVDIFQCSIGKHADEVLRDIEKDLLGFHEKFSYSAEGINYHNIPFLHNLDLERFADASIGYISDGYVEEVGKVYRGLAERHTADAKWDPEKFWCKELREYLRKKAEMHSFLAQAHLQSFLNFFWRFGEPTESKCDQDGESGQLIGIAGRE